MFVVGPAISQTNTFSQSGSFGTGTGDEQHLPVRLVADLNGDGANDIVSHDFDGDMRLYLNDPSQPGTSYTYSTLLINLPRYAFMAAGDVDGDGDLDLAVSDGTIYLNQLKQTGFSFTELKNPNNTIFSFKNPENTGVIQDIKFADMNKDGLNDIVWLNAWSGGERKNEIWLHGNNSNIPSFVFSQAFTHGFYNRAVMDIADIDGDNDLDIVTGKSSSKWGSLEKCKWNYDFLPICWTI